MWDQCTTLKQQSWTSSREVTMAAVPSCARGDPQRDQFQISVRLHEQLVLPSSECGIFLLSGYSEPSNRFAGRCCGAVLLPTCYPGHSAAAASAAGGGGRGSGKRAEVRTLVGSGNFCRPVGDQITGVRIPSTARRGSLEPVRVLLAGWRRVYSSAVAYADIDLSLPALPG